MSSSSTTGTTDPVTGVWHDAEALAAVLRGEGEERSDEESVLGRDPFVRSASPDPFLTALVALGPAHDDDLEARAANPGHEAARRQAECELHTLADRIGLPRGTFERVTLREAPAVAAPAHRLRWVSTPKLADVEVPPQTDWIDLLLDEDARRRLAAIGRLASPLTSIGEVRPQDPAEAAPTSAADRYDRFGLSADVLKRAFPIFQALYQHYFRVRSVGHEHLPTHGPAILAANHGGLLPFDGAMIVVDVALRSDPPRLTRAVVDRWAGSLPFVGVFYARVGQVIGSRANVSDLLEEGQLLLVFPEGMAGIVKPVSQRYRLQEFHTGFVRQALLHGAPIIPTAVIGSDDQAPILYDLKPLAQALGLPALPITPTFPLLGPLGLLPMPVSYRIVYGEPLCFHERFGPDDAKDARLVHHLARQSRRSVQALIDRHR